MPSPSLHTLRIIRLAALALTVLLGLASRRWPVGWVVWDKLAGDALYAVAAYLALGLLVPRLPVLRLAALAFGFCVAIELFQLTGLPMAYRHVPGVRWIFGTTFGWGEIVAYGVGVAVVALVERWLVRAAQQPMKGLARPEASP